MNAKDWIFLLLAVLAGGAVVVYILIPAQPGLAPANPSLSLDVLSDAKINEPILVTLTGTHLKEKTIQFHDGEKIQPFSCTSDPCVFSFTLLFSTTGSRTLDARVETLLRVTQTIRVSSSQLVCLDGTVEGACVFNGKPLRCTNASLIPDCDACGCPAGQTCENHACIPAPITFSLLRLEAPAQAYTTASTSIQIGITPTAPVPVNGAYVFFLDEYNEAQSKINETPHTIQLTNASPQTQYAFSIEQTLDSKTRGLGGRWYTHGGTYDASALLAQTTHNTPILVSEDTTPPGAPTNLTFISSGEDNQFRLTWDASPSGDVIAYQIYQQVTANGGFTAYDVLASTPHTQFNVPAPAADTAYVIRALDGAGNESPASNPIVVPAP